MVARVNHRDARFPPKGRTTFEGQTPPDSRHLKKILSPFRSRYRKILRKRAKLNFVGSRRTTTTPYQTIVYQENLDDLRIAIRDLESEIAQNLLANVAGLVRDLLDISVWRTLSRDHRKRVVLPESPKNPREIRSMLYRMYRGGTFYPLIFPREVEAEFYRVLGQMVSRQGMRGKEVVQQTRKRAIRQGIKLREMIYHSLEQKDYLIEIGPVRWTWRRGKTVRRLAFAPVEMREEAKRVAGILNQAVAKRQMASGRTTLRS